MILITGAAGFIGSYLAGTLNRQGVNDLVLVDDFSREEKKPNTANKFFKTTIHRDDLDAWFKTNHARLDFVCHIGARTDTTEFNSAIFDRLNLNYSKMVWNACTLYKIPLVYASSAATYGDGKLGYSDNHELIPSLLPLNPYGLSKQAFDEWVLNQHNTPPSWIGLKFFNVYGPNEYHKGRMASVVFHAFNQIRDTGAMKLFRSHNPLYKDGEQARDFIFVQDIADVILFLMDHQQDSGIYNLGTGHARTFLALVNAVFKARQSPPNITFIDTPLDIRDKYQYFTEADTRKLRSIGYKKPFTSLEEGVTTYVQSFLQEKEYF